MRPERDRLLAVQLMSLRAQDQQADEGGRHRDQQHDWNAFGTDSKRARRHELDVPETHAVLATQPAVASAKQHGSKDHGGF